MTDPRQPCPACGAVADLVCEACALPVPLAAGADAYAALGIAPRLALDAAALDAARRTRALRVHPDRFASRGPEALATARALATAVNDAWRALADPVRRGRTWLERRGVRLAERSDAVPAALAASVFAAREALEAVRGAPTDRAAHAALREASATIETAWVARATTLDAVFQAADAGAADPEAVRRAVAEAGYLSALRAALRDAAVDAP